MSNKKISEGFSIDLPLAADVTVGKSPVVVGDIVAVVEVTGVAGELRAHHFTGVYELPKKTGVGAGFPAGTKLYLDPADGKMTETAGALKLAGYAWKLSGDNDATTWVRLLG